MSSRDNDLTKIPAINNYVWNAQKFPASIFQVDQTSIMVQVKVFEVLWLLNDILKETIFGISSFQYLW